MGAADNDLYVGDSSTTTVALGSNTLTLNTSTNTARIDINSAISGTGGITQTGPGSVVLGGSTANTYTGTTAVQDGFFQLNKTAGVTAVSGSSLIIGDNSGAPSSAVVFVLADNQISDATDVTLNADGRLVMYSSTDRVSQIAGTGVIDMMNSGSKLTIGTDNSSSVFDGTMVGNGSFVKEGTGSLTLTQDISLNNGTFELNAGTLVLDSMALSVGTLTITGDSVIDFGTAGGGSELLVNNLNFLNTSITLNILNWTKGVDAFYASVWPGATYDQVNNGNTAPMNQIVFAGWSPSDTGWDSYDSQIYPKVPEPSTYGLMFMGASVAFVGYRRWRKSRAKSAT